MRYVPSEAFLVQEINPSHGFNLSINPKALLLRTTGDECRYSTNAVIRLLLVLLVVRKLNIKMRWLVARQIGRDDTESIGSSNVTSR